MPDRRLLARDIPGYVAQLEAENVALRNENAALREAVAAGAEAIEAELALVGKLRAEVARQARQHAKAVTHGYDLGFDEGRQYEGALRG